MKIEIIAVIKNRLIAQSLFEKYSRRRCFILSEAINFRSCCLLLLTTFNPFLTHFPFPMSNFFLSTVVSSKKDKKKTIFTFVKRATKEPLGIKCVHFFFSRWKPQTSIDHNLWDACVNWKLKWNTCVNERNKFGFFLSTNSINEASWWARMKKYIF